MKYSFRIIAVVFIGAMVLAAFVFLTPQTTKAITNLRQVSDVINNSQPNVGANHTISFITHSGIPASGNITITPEPNSLDIPSAMTFADIDISINGTPQTLATSAGTGSGGAWGIDVVSGTSGSFEITLNDTDAVPAGATVAIRIGTHTTFQSQGNNQIINPAAGNYRISFETHDAANSLIDRSETFVAIVEPVAVSAETASTVQVVIQWAIPELRVGAANTNDDIDFVLYVHSAAEGDGTNVYTDALFVTPAVLSSNNDGTYSTAIDLGVGAGTYDVIIKGHQHLSKKLNDIPLVDGINALNFTTTDNSASFGTEVLSAGDVSNSATDPASFGDNVVNAIDLSILLGNLDDIDADGNSIRANVNQDTEVNAIDMSIFLKNLDQLGDTS